MDRNRTKIIFYVLLFVASNFSLAQLTQPVKLIYLPQGHSLTRLSGGGNLVASQSSSTNITSINPAAIGEIGRLTAGVTFQMNSSISEAWAADIGYERNSQYYPPSFNLSYRLNAFALGLGSNQIYNGTVDYGEITMTVLDDNEMGYTEVGKTHPKRKEIVFKNSAIFSYNFKDLLNLPSDLSFGIQYNYNILRSSFEVKSEIDSSDWNLYPEELEWDKKLSASNFAIGIKYSIETNVLKVFDVGIFYESQLDFDENIKINANKTKFYGHIPAKVHIGGQIGLYNGLTVSANYSYYFWELINGTNELNQKELIGNLTYLINQNFTTTIGALVTDQQYDINDDVFDINNSLFATYLTMGVIHKYQNYEFDLSFADSHLFSNNWRKQTILKLGIGYCLQ